MLLTCYINMLSFSSLILLLSLFASACGGYAPMDAPKLPEGFCDPKTGDVTETTGECMCKWQDRKGCIGSKCSYEMGLSWYHYTCKDCKCVAEPSS